MKARPRLVVRATLALLLIAMAALIATALWQSDHAPVTIVGARRSGASSRVTLDIRNDAPGRVRLYALDFVGSHGQ